MLRDFTREDIDFAIRLGVDEWGDYSGLSKAAIWMIGDSAVKSFFDRTTYAKIYEEDGEAVGLVLGAVKGDKVLFPDIEREDLKDLSKEISNELLLEDETDRALLEECSDKGYDCELVYFIASKRMRGRGIGTKLIDSYIDYLRSRGMKRMFLYTDDFSRYRFYERMGFVRDACKTIFIDGGDHEYYIYSKEL